MRRSTKAEVSGRLKAMGLGPDGCAKCLGTFLAAGEERAMQQAQEILDTRAERLQMARMLAREILKRRAQMH